MSEEIPLSATLLLLRDRASSIEVLMIERHAEAVFAGGALVFPGGRLDPEDRAPQLLAHCRAVPGEDVSGMGLRVCAIRETFEEVGILLARVAGEEDLLSGAQFDAIMARLTQSLGRAPDFATLVVEGGLVLATDLLVPFAHWITPKPRPRRFDTYFYLAPAPAAQKAVHDGSEAVDSIWVEPAQAAVDGAARRVKMIFATRFNLLKLARCDDREAAFAAACAAKIVTVCPEYRDTPKGPMWEIPLEAGYGASLVPITSEVVS